MFGRLWEVDMSKKCTPLWREDALSTFPSRNPTDTTCSDHFWTFRCRFPWQEQGIVHLVKTEQNVELCSSFKSVGRRGTFEEDLQRCIFHGRRSTRDMFIRDVRRAGRWFPEKGCILEHQIFRFAQIILRDRCSTSYDLASLFRGRRSTLDRWSGNIAKRTGTRPSALHSNFHFGRKSRKIALFLMLSTWKIEEVSQNSFVLRKSRRIAAFLMLSSSKLEEVSQNCFVFKLADWQIDR